MQLRKSRQIRWLQREAKVVFDCVEKDRPKAPEKTTGNSERSTLLPDGEKGLKESLIQIQKDAPAEKTPTVLGSQFQRAMSDLTLSVEANDLKGRQSALIELAKMESSFKPSAGRALETFSSKTEGGIDSLRARQVEFARAFARGGDEAVMQLAKNSLGELTQNGDDPKARVKSMLDLAIASFTLNSKDNAPMLMLAQSLDLAKELKMCASGNPAKTEDLKETLDVLAAMQRDNPFAKSIRNRLGIDSPKDLENCKQEVTSPDKPEAANKFKAKLDEIIDEQKRSLANELKKYFEEKRPEQKPEQNPEKSDELKFAPEAKKLESVDWAICDVSRPTGAKDLAKKLAADPDGSLGRTLFGEAGTPAHLKALAAASQSARPWNEDSAKALFATSLIARKTELEDKVDGQSRPKIPYLEETVQGPKDFIAAEKQLAKANAAIEEGRARDPVGFALAEAQNLLGAKKLTADAAKQDPDSPEGRIRQRAAAISAEKADAHLPEAMRVLLDKCGQLNAAGPTARQQLGVHLDVFIDLWENAPKNDKTRALLERAAKSADGWLGADHPSARKLQSLLQGNDPK